uniref:SAP domain-containing protein n=1 Tax=Octactis speculum TaxID=3111310 RepID=A0A7S2AIA7_9STRA
MTVATLKSRCRDQNLPVSGKKALLIDRLTAAAAAASQERDGTAASTSSSSSSHDENQEGGEVPQAGVRGQSHTQCVVRPAALRELVPLTPAVYNLLVQPIEGAELVDNRLRPLMEPESPIGWLYHQGCNCSTCADFHRQIRPLSQRLSFLAPRRSTEEDEAEFNTTNNLMAGLTRSLSVHEQQEHGGEKILFNQLPSREELEAIIAPLQGNDGPIPENKAWRFSKSMVFTRAATGGRIMKRKGEWKGSGGPMKNKNDGSEQKPPVVVVSRPWSSQKPTRRNSSF